MRILIAGNCQTFTLKQILNVLLPGVVVDRIDIAAALRPETAFDRYDKVLLQDHPRLAPIKRLPHFLTFPNMSFLGYHPDMVVLRRSDDVGGSLVLSNIVLGAFNNGLNERQCLSLFTESFVAELKYDRIFIAAKRELIAAMDRSGMNGKATFDRWHLQAPFMLNGGHPKLFAMVDIARQLCRRMGLRARPVDPSTVVTSVGNGGHVFPSYNQERDWNHLLSRDSTYFVSGKAFDRKAFITRCYAELAKGKGHWVMPESRVQAFLHALTVHRRSDKPAPSRVNPYTGRPATSFWKGSVSGIDASAVSPAVRVKPVVREGSKVATAGSCFAQHISRTLVGKGLTYYVAEQAPAEMAPEQAQARHYGVFSARYGNVYTARQLLQLLGMALGEFKPVEKSWVSASGRHLDPFRPNIGEEFDTQEEVVAARQHHLEAVRKMFETLDVFVFTLGLTESWMHIEDGAVYPVAPGVLSQHVDPGRYRFKNFNQQEVVADMAAFLDLLFSINRRAQVILTVSPVPLIATYEPDHVLNATTYSKSVLRAAAQTLSEAFDAVQYFPSYEIITGHYNGGRYYEDDLRNVRPAGVDHVMQVFMRSMVSLDASAPAAAANEQPEAAAPEVLAEIKDNADLVCDEELIAARK